jgi:hypothetical protein
MNVRIENPERMNLMGLLMRGLLETSLKTAAGQSGTMGVTLSFTESEVVLRSDASGKPRASVRGEMKPLLEMVAGGSLVGPVLRRKVKVGGNLLMLLRLLPLIRPKKA